MAIDQFVISTARPVYWDVKSADLGKVLGWRHLYVLNAMFQKQLWPFTYS